jgi:hypothetical protein
MTSFEKTALIDQLDKSFLAMPRVDKVITKHALGAPDINPLTNQPFKSFREVIEQATDETLEMLRDDFQSNDQLLPITFEKQK